MQFPSNLSEQRYSEIVNLQPPALPKRSEGMGDSDIQDTEPQIPDTPTKLTQESQKNLEHSEPLEPQDQQPPQPSSLMAVRESKLPPKLPLTGVMVTSSVNKATVLVPHRSYVIKFEWKGTPRTIERRYSNVELLRNALMVLLPFTYIPPAHHKSISVFEEEHLAVVRGAEITRFFAYLLQDPILFNQGGLTSSRLRVF